MARRRFDGIQFEIQSEIAAALVERIRGTLGLIIGVFVPFAVADLVLHGDRLVWLYALKVVGIGVAVAALHRLRGRAVERERAVKVALGAIGTIYLVVALSGVLTGDAVTASILCTALTVGTATLLPWGTGPQLVSALAALAALVINVYGVGGGLEYSIAYPMIGALVAMGASLYVSHELERTRIGMAQDVIERDLAEAARRETENRYRGLVQSASEVIYTHDLEGRLTSFNGAAERLTGYSAAEASMMNIAQLLAPEARGPAQLALASIAAGDETVRAAMERGTHVHEILTKDGRLVLIEASLRVIFRDGAPVGIQGIARDVTERRRTEEALGLLASIVESSDDAIVGRTLDGVIVSWNAGAERLYGYPAAEVVGRPIFFLVPDDRSDEVPLFMEAIRRGDRILHFETVRVRKDGRRIDVSMSVSPIRDASGNIMGASSIARDITDRVQAQEALRRAHDELEKRVAERTDELLRANALLREEIAGRERTEAALQQAKEAAETGDRAKSRFVATMSHEIRTPMNAVIGMTGLLLDTRLTAEQQEYVRTIRQSGVALLTLINDVLDFSKIGAGKMELEKRPFNLRECIEESLDLVAHPATEKGVTLMYAMHERVPEGLVGDIGRLRQILVNLAGNAVKFTARGRVVVNVAPDGGDEPGLRPPPRGVVDVCRLHFAVEDTGIGIPPEKMDRLFLAFSQVGSSTTAQYGGTGLGLAISRRLVELMGGTMWVESKVGRGSIFHFTLAAPTAPTDPRRALNGPQAEIEGRRLLLAENDPVVRNIVAAQTRTWGLAPHAALSALDALQLLEQGEEFDVALLGQQVADTAGAAIEGRMREACHAAGLPLILVRATPRKSPPTGAPSSAPEPSAVLTCPLKFTQLHAALTELATGRKGAAVSRLSPQRIDTGLAERLPLRILIAEDNEVIQRLVRRILERMGYRPDLAATGLEVLGALERQSYDVILMDIGMPEMDGLEATSRIVERWPSDARPRIIAMTAYAQREDREACLAAGMSDYLSKPVEIEALQAALERSAPVARRPEQPPAATRESPVDRGVFVRLREGQSDDEPDLVTELIDIFLLHTPGRLAALQGAVAQRDAEMMQEVAHRLKSSSAQLGAGRMAALAADLESKGRQRSLEGADAAAAAMIEEFERVRGVLADERRPGPEGAGSVSH